MKKLRFITCCMLASSFFIFSSCSDDDSTLPEIDENGLTREITDVIPIEFIDEIKALGMPIYGGNKPPLLTRFAEEVSDESKSFNELLISGLPLLSQDLEATFVNKSSMEISDFSNNFLKSSSQEKNSLTFYSSPIILLNGNNLGDIPGTRFANSKFILKNQNNKKLTIDFHQDEENGLAISEGVGSYIVGTDCEFTIFAIMNSTHKNGSKAQTAKIISGSIAPDGVEKLHITLLMLDDYGDPNKDLMEVGTARVFHDSDQFSPRQGIAERTWYSNLPPCPCTYDEVIELAKNNTNLIGCSDGTWSICGEINTDYHYRATYEVRWFPTKKGDPGQQCTYDKNKKLITEGLAAGSPDKVSPLRCGILEWNIDFDYGHVTADVDTWKKLPAVEYLRDWPANNVLACGRNVVSGINHMLKLVGQMTAPEVIEIIKNANDNTYNIPADLRKYILGEKVSLTDAQILEHLKTWKKNADDENWLESDLEESLNMAINNMQ